MKNYGKELILDLHNCDPDTYNTREKLEDFIWDLTDKIGVERAQIHWWDYAGRPKEYSTAPPHLKGTSVVQFIKTSTVVIHSLDEMKQMYINVFSCDDFSVKDVEELVVEYFDGEIVTSVTVDRK